MTVLTLALASEVGVETKLFHYFFTKEHMKLHKHSKFQLNRTRNARERDKKAIGLELGSYQGLAREEAKKTLFAQDSQRLLSPLIVYFTTFHYISLYNTASVLSGSSHLNELEMTRQRHQCTVYGV
jgi:hypothetical protein